MGASLECLRGGRAGRLYVIYTHIHACTHARTHANIRTHARTHAPTHARTHPRTHARTHTHTHKYVHIYIQGLLLLAWCMITNAAVSYTHTCRMYTHTHTITPLVVVVHHDANAAVVAGLDDVHHTAALLLPRRRSVLQEGPQIRTHMLQRFSSKVSVFARHVTVF
jgi:hypothetical protein